MTEDWAIDLLDEILNKGWKGIYLSGTSSHERRDEEFSSRTYVYEKNGKYYKRTWHDDLVGSQWKGFSTNRYWDAEEEITQAEYNNLKAGKNRIDTAKNAQNLQKQKQKRDQRRKQEEAQRAAEEAAKPPCPKCRKKMVRRKSEYGPFWGCQDYPQCTGKRK